MHAVQPTATAPSPFASGARLVAADGRELPLRDIALDVDARAGLATVVLEQRFANPFAEPLVVTYSLPLPHDAAVAGFAFRIGERRVVGELEGRDAARERYEQALFSGRAAALLEQERGSLFTQEVGNIPPGEEVVVELTLDQPLAWLADGVWEWRFPLAVAPRYLGAEGRVPDAGRVFQNVAPADDGAPDLRLRAVLRDRLAADARPSSPSHAIVVRPDEAGLRIELHETAEQPVDRDLVLRWAVAGAQPESVLDVARPAPDHARANSAFALLTLTPPDRDHREASLPTDLVLLIDTSGSMSGRPLAAAKAVAIGLVRHLGADDTLEMVAFGSTPRRWKSAAVSASHGTRHEAERWIGDLRADGGTEMVAGMLAALRAGNGAGRRQVVLITDGLVGFEPEVVAAIRRAMTRDTRLHSVGIGSASNRSLTAACARAGRGVEVLIGIDEEAEAGAARVIARLAEPIVTSLELSGDALLDAVPASLPDLHAGFPARLGLRVRPEGGALRVRGLGVDGPFDRQLAVPGVAPGEGSASVVRLYGRETIEDLELELAAGAERTVLDREIERTALDFRVASRLTSWVAVSEEPEVDPRQAVRRVRQPQRLPHGLSAEGLGLAPPVTSARSLRGRYASKSMNMPVFETDDLPTSPMVDAAPPVDGEFHAMERPVRRRARALPLRKPTLIARVVHRQDDRLVIEITVTRGALEWRVPDQVEITWQDGRREMVHLVAERSTADSRVEPGATVRLVLDLGWRRHDDTPVELHLRSALYGSRNIDVEAAHGRP